MYESITPNIMVKSVKATTKFYLDVLGFTLVTSVPGEKDDTFAIVAKDQIILMFQDMQSLIQEYETLAQSSITPMLTLFITVDDIQSLYEELKGKVAIAKELHQTFYGKLEFAIFDNNKHILTLASKE